MRCAIPHACESHWAVDANPNDQIALPCVELRDQQQPSTHRRGEPTRAIDDARTELINRQLAPANGLPTKTNQRVPCPHATHDHRHFRRVQSARPRSAERVVPKRALYRNAGCIETRCTETRCYAGGRPRSARTVACAALSRSRFDSARLLALRICASDAVDATVVATAAARCWRPSAPSYQRVRLCNVIGRLRIAIPAQRRSVALMARHEVHVQVEDDLARCRTVGLEQVDAVRFEDLHEPSGHVVNRRADVDQRLPARRPTSTSGTCVRGITNVWPWRSGARSRNATAVSSS